MGRNSRIWLSAAGAASTAAALLWYPAAAPSPRLVAAAWLLFGCLVALAWEQDAIERLVLALFLLPGLHLTLCFQAASKTLPALGLEARLWMAFGVHAVFCGLARQVADRRLRTLLRAGITAAVVLAFAYGLWNRSLLLSAGLLGCSACALWLVRSRKIHG
jgi:hypothetical protein